MNIKEIYEKFDKIGCCTFATIDEGYPETRIAHFLAYDEDGLYFETMNTKPFYKQLKETGKISVCGLFANSKGEKDEEGNPIFEAGYFIRLTGDVKEITIDKIKEKNNPDFYYFIEDAKRYPAMTGFVIYRAKVEIYDYDFEKISREHKLERERISYGGFATIKPGFSITNDCIKCGRCKKVCTFDAIEEGKSVYSINGKRCDECGNCAIYCPVKAIKLKN